MGKNIIVYHSQSGNTKKIAELIQAAVGGELAEIGAVGELSEYDVVFVGTPNWSGTATPAVRGFLEERDLSGKTVVPFCTHGMGGLQNIATDITALCPNSNVLPSFAI
ncbi:MAG: hypothetical protein LBC28_04730, partial [Oscillospiraceae bacterium]|nr:hypothetical protein [Oscillospiraceae bacterium]